jgi:hypothetical protein
VIPLRKLGIGVAVSALALLFFLPQTAWLLRGLFRAIVAAALWQPMPAVRIEGEIASWPLLVLGIWALVALLATLFCGGVAGMVLTNPQLWHEGAPRVRVQLALLLLLVGGAAWWGAGAAHLIGAQRLTGALSGITLLFPLAIGMLSLAFQGRQQGKAAPVSILTGLATLSLPTAFGLSLLCAIFLLLTARP